MWSFTCHTEHMLKSGLPSTQYFHPLSSCFSHVPPTEYIYMFRICQPMVDDSKFSRMLTAGTRRWSHTSFLHYTTHTHTQPQYPCTETPIYRAFPLAALRAEGALTSKTASKLREGGGGGEKRRGTAWRKDGGWLGVVGGVCYAVFILY